MASPPRQPALAVADAFVFSLLSAASLVERPFLDAAALVRGRRPRRGVFPSSGS